MTRREEAETQNIRFTAAVVLASALARHEMDAVKPADFVFTLLAAAGSDLPALPSEPIRDARHLLALTVSSGEGNLRLHLQAEGYAALSEVARAVARLVSSDGVIDQPFGFDSQGHGLLVLRDTVAVRAALRRFRVILTDR